MMAEFLGSAAEWRRNPKPNFALGYPLYRNVDGFLLELARNWCDLRLHAARLQRSRPRRNSRNIVHRRVIHRGSAE
jgi:hypothetical protein